MSRWLKQYDDEVKLEIWRNQPQYFYWWSEIKINAALKPRFKNPGNLSLRVRVTYGEWPVTITYLAKIWDIDRETVKTFLQCLVDEDLITLRTTGKVTVISIINFERFYANMPSGGEGDAFDPSLYETDNETPGRTAGKTSDETVDGIVDGNACQTADETADILIEEREKKKNLEIDVNARELEFFENLKASDMTVEKMMKSLRVEKESLLALLEDFYNYSVSTDQFHQDFSRFKSHFMNWARIQIRENNIQTQKTNNYGKRTKSNGSAVSRTAERRGSEGSGISVDDYSKPLPD